MKRLSQEKMESHSKRLPALTAVRQVQVGSRTVTLEQNPDVNGVHPAAPLRLRSG